jgi:hypothetical protein
VKLDEVGRIAQRDEFRTRFPDKRLCEGFAARRRW